MAHTPRQLTVSVECDGCLVHNLNCTNGSPAIQGFMSDGMFAEYAAIDRHNAIVLPESLDMETSAPYFCAGITGTYELFASFGDCACVK